MPRNPEPTKRRILGAAERLFARDGFDGVSLREIAAEADANLALIHYHFGSKLDLYRAIWADRYTPEVANRRDLGFATIDYSQSRQKVIRALVELYLIPIMKMTDLPAFRDFVSIGAREWTDPKEEERGVLEEFLDPTAKRFLSCFAKALPEIPPYLIAYGYEFMLGCTVLHVVDQNRIARISKGAVKGRDAEAATGPLIEFCVSGWLGLAKMHGESAPEQESTSGMKSSKAQRKRMASMRP
jgi:AcrR family transcriptional regulator